MKEMRTGFARRTLAVVAATVLLFAGLSLLGYSLFSRAEPASAKTPQKVKDTSEQINEGNQGPRAEVPKDEALKLTVPDMKRVENLPVYDVAPAGYEKALHDGAAHVKGTGMPWQRQANVYIAGHRIGFPGTKSHLVFWDLDKLENGDEVILTDANGTRYTYEVFKQFTFEPDEERVLDPVEGSNVVTLQSCTLPNYARRLAVQAELKDVR